MNRLILSSNSKRRHQILHDAGYDFEIKSLEVDETADPTIQVDSIAKMLAVKKNRANRDIDANAIILTADTVVIANDQLLGKPKDQADAEDMLQLISDKTHVVISGVAISNMEKMIDFDDLTVVRFKKLTTNEIDLYIEKFKPFDKAGSYGIQEWIGMIGIESIKGSYYNVMGLPIHKVYRALDEEFGILPFN